MRWRASRVAAIRSAVAVSRVTGARPVRDTQYPRTAASSTPVAAVTASQRAARSMPSSTLSERSATWRARPFRKSVVSIRAG